jgi:thiol-disulfide isomerase/thioredoxin
MASPPLTPQFVGTEPQLGPSTRIRFKVPGVPVTPQNDQGCSKTVCKTVIPILLVVALLFLGFLIWKLGTKKHHKRPKPHPFSPSSPRADPQPHPRNVPEFREPSDTVPRSIYQQLDQRYQHPPASSYQETAAAAPQPKKKILYWNDEQFNNHVTQGKQPAVVAFVMNGCGHCENMKAAFAQAAASSPIPMVMMEREHAGSLLGKYRVRGFPTVILFQNGEAVKEYQGDRNVQSLIAFANQ